MKRFVFAMLLLAAGCRSRPSSFTCTSDPQCGQSGTCEPTQSCSFPDASCPSGRRYGGFAAPELANLCVDGNADAGTDGSAPPTCGGAGQPCCATSPACSSPSLMCTNGVCTGCFTALAAGEAHTCALRRDGQVYCWGANDHGQLGNGTVADAPLPVAVVDNHGAPLGNVSALVAGARHTCLLRGDQTLWCFGDDTDGQLGIGGNAAQNPVPTELGLTPALSVGAGARHSCATTTGGLAWCWGANDTRQLGTGGTATAMPQPVLKSAVQLANVTALAGGVGHSCARISDGTLDCWGDDAQAELGTGVDATSQPPSQVVALGSTVSAVAAGDAFSCVLDTSGVVSCFGANDHGQSSGQPSTTPTIAPTQPFADPMMFTQVAAGDAFACARRSDGAVRCWGANARAQVDVTPSTSASSVRMLGAGAIATGGAHLCATTDSGVVCVGAGDRGQLGDGASADSAQPTMARVSCP